MKFSLKKAIIVLLLVIFHAGIFYYGSKYAEIARLGAGYKAKLLCSAVFLSKRPADTVLAEEFSHPLLQYFDAKIDYENRTVTADLLFGLIERKATYTDPYGAILDFEETELDTSLDILPENSVIDSMDMWLVDSSNFPPEIDLAKLNSAVAEAFNEPDTANMRRTRAVVILYKGKIIAERYASPVTENTPLLGWSMSKSVINALVGIFVKQGKLDIDEPVPVPEWQQPDDTRRLITYDHMLRMTPGLQFDESYENPRSDVIVMLFGKKDNAAFAAKKPLIHKPGSHWNYSSGTTNIICRALREEIGGDYEDYLRFPYQELFHKIGMNSAVFETDGTGTFVGSSFLYATARDWARLGQLYLQNGVWNGERILPEGWIEYSRRRTEISRQQRYGAHFWLPQPYPPNREDYVSIPADLFYLSGHYGQYVSVIPSKKLVVVRMGQTDHSAVWNQYLFLGKILDAINSE